MKNIFLLFVALCFATTLSAQNKQLSKASIDKIKKAQSTFSLDEEQTVSFRKIVERNANNMADIEALKTSDPALYQQKMMAAIQGNEASVKRLLNAEQLKIYQAEKLKKRNARAAFVTELKKQGKSKVEMQKALIDWELAQ